MNQSVQQHETPTAVLSKLDTLRIAIRRYVWLYGVAALFCAIGAAFWVSLVLDWFFEPPAAFRVVMQLAVIGTVLWLFYQIILDRLRRPLTDSNMALLLERHFPELGDSLLTIIDPHSETTLDESDLTVHLYQEAREQAAQSVTSLDIRRIFDYKILRRSAVGAGILWLLIAIFVVLLPGAAQVWANRVLGLSSELWPRQTWLELAGADNNTLKVARGDNLEVIVKADMKKVIPQAVYVQRYMESGREDEKTMTREGVAVSGQDPYQLFTHTFHAVREPFELYVEGGDADLGPIRVEVVDSPVVASMKLRYEYPEYMERDDHEVTVIGPMSIPQGTTIHVLGVSAKKLTDIRGELVGGNPKEKDKNQIPVTLNSEDAYRFQCELPKLMDSASYRFTLKDTDGIQGRDPFILNLTALNDEAPVLPDDLYGIGPYISPNAYLPIRGLATDDHGIAQICFEYTINPEKKGQKSEGTEGDQKPSSSGPQAVEMHGRKLIVGFDKNCPQEYQLNAVLDLKRRTMIVGDDKKKEGIEEKTDAERPTTLVEVNDLKIKDPRTKQSQSIFLTPGQKLAVVVSAVDRCTLGSGANVGSCRRRVLEVVEPYDLYIKLQGQELVRRQRFEAIIREVEETRNILDTLEFVENPSKKKQMQDDLSLRRARENCRKHAEETRAVVDILENIRLQMVHNRLDKDIDDVEGHLRKLENKVIVPLKGIIDTPASELGREGASSKKPSVSSFPELELGVEQILAQVKNPEAAYKKQKEVVTEFDVTLRVMNQVLESMVEQEDLQKLRAMLKKIQDETKAMEQKIKDKKRNEFKGLLE